MHTWTSGKCAISLPSFVFLKNTLAMLTKEHQNYLVLLFVGVVSRSKKWSPV